VDAALTFKAVHGRVVNEPLDRAARERELDAVAELHRVNLSPENRFEASPLRGNSTAPGLSGVTLAGLCAMAAITPWYCGCRPGRHTPGGHLSPNSPAANQFH